MPTPSAEPFHRWYAATRARHWPLASFPDVRKGIQSLSELYVERRTRLETGKALEGVARRAAFALFYAPLHFLVVRNIVGALGAALPCPRTILDLGCGTGAAGGAWGSCAAAGGGTPRLELVDESGWAIDEARATLQALDLHGRAWRGPLEGARLPARGGAIVAAYAVNELETDARDRLLPRLLRARDRGARLLIVEPISRAVTPWWDEWSAAFRERGGRDDDWRFPGALPDELQELDQASGLRHDELTARSLWLPGASGGES